MASLEPEIAEWRSFVEAAPAVDGHDVDELEAHLRDQIADLSAAGLAEDEAFLIAVKRMGRLDDLSREFALEHSGRLWRQLVLSQADAEGAATSGWQEAVLFATFAAVAVQVARLLAGFPDDTPAWFVRNVSLFVLPFLTAWLSWRRHLTVRQMVPATLAFAAAGVLVNVYPFSHDAATEALAAGHLPVVLWFVVAFPYMGGTLRSHERRMDFVRFTGEWCIYYALIALGGGVLVGLTVGILGPAGLDPDRIAQWIIPSGAAGAVIIAAWLVESKQRIVENMAPVLTAIFTPLFAAMLTVAAVTYAATGLGDAFDRDLVSVFDVLMVVVLGLVLYGMSAREPSVGPGWSDRIELVAVVSALLLDLMVLTSMAARISDLGLTPNRVAAVGLNLVLLADLTRAAWLSVQLLRGRGTRHQLERWQTTYLPVFAVWAAVVVVVLPLAFGFD